ncbi:hypothetical protein LINPERPRIM_LOCUS11183 [Linum perenne]
MATLRFPWLLFIFLLSSLPISISGSTVYDYLHQNGLPIGLFPDGITNFSVDPTTGRFQINLTHPCDVKLQNQLHYDFNISGLLSFGRIEELFLWFPVKGIRVDDPTSGLINFDVGVVDKQFTLSMFEIPSPCTHSDYSSSSSVSYWLQVSPSLSSLYFPIFFSNVFLLHILCLHSWKKSSQLGISFLEVRVPT